MLHKINSVGLLETVYTTEWMGWISVESISATLMTAILAQPNSPTYREYLVNETINSYT